MVFLCICLIFAQPPKSRKIMACTKTHRNEMKRDPPKSFVHFSFSPLFRRLHLRHFYFSLQLSSCNYRVFYLANSINKLIWVSPCLPASKPGFSQMHARDKTILSNCFVDDKMKLKLLLFIVSLVAVAVAVIAAVSFTIAFVIRPVCHYCFSCWCL